MLMGWLLDTGKLVKAIRSKADMPKKWRERLRGSEK